MADTGMLTDVAYPEGFYPEWLLEMIVDMTPEQQQIIKEKYLAMEQGGKGKIGE